MNKLVFILTLNVPIPDKMKKLILIFISIQLSEMNWSLRVKENWSGQYEEKIVRSYPCGRQWGYSHDQK